MPPKAAALSMSRAKPAAAYHHGDLRSALIAEAAEALKAETPEMVTLKSLALRLGVSQPAPYRHFANRDALMAAVAAEGFRRFEDRLKRAADGAPPALRLTAACQAYLAFARENFGVYRLMFASRLAAGAEPDGELGAASRSAFNHLLAAIARHGGARARAVALWSALHGAAMLASEGLLPGPDQPGEVRLDGEAVAAELSSLFASAAAAPPDHAPAPASRADPAERF